MKFLIVIVIFLVDRISKELMKRTFFGNFEIGFGFSFSLTHNYGAALGLEIPRRFLIIFSFLALFILIFLYRRYKYLGIGLILGGLLGNLYDRVFYGYVIDFIHIKNLFVFNLADLFITVGGVLVFFKLIK